MKPQARELFAEALELPASRRERFLEQACGGDDGLRREVEAMLADLLKADEFFGDIDGTTLGAEEFRGIEGEGEGESIGPYLLCERIGEGGFGVVWRAEQRVPITRNVALKVIKAGMDTREVLARFEAERQVLAMMDHPNIAMVLDAGATRAGRPYFAMELVQGVPITRFCKQADMEIPGCLALFLEVCAAIQHAHQKGIIHRDIKPSNVLVSGRHGRPVVKVIDFGIAKAIQGKLADRSLVTRSGQFLGTPVYMSPEQADRGGQDIDTRSDIYSLGILLYELLAGVPPYEKGLLESAGDDEVCRMIREVDPVRPSARSATIAGPRARSGEVGETPRRRDIEPDLDWIVMKAIEKDRGRRYESVDAFAGDIQRFLADEPVSARPPSTGYQLRKFARRHKTAFRVGALLAAMMTVATILSSGWAIRATRAENASGEALAELRATAPAFAVQARTLAAQERFGEAIEKLDYALKLQPDQADYQLAKADLLQSQLKLGEAAAAYREAQRMDPSLEAAGRSASLCEELLSAPPASDGGLSRESLSRLHVALLQGQRPAAEIMPVARLLGEERKLLVDYWSGRLTEVALAPDRPLAERLEVRDDGLLALDLSDTKVVDLSRLAGMPLGALDLSGCGEIANFAALAGFPLLKSLDLQGTKPGDLAALQSLPLEDLDLSDTPVADLSPLKDCRLEQLSIRGTRVSDLVPIAAMPLRVLDASGIPATDFSRLAGAPLEICQLENVALRDLSFLEGAPLRVLGLAGCREARGYRVLATMESLQELELPGSFRELPAAELAALGALRDLPGLTEIRIGGKAGARDVRDGPAKEGFWKAWDRERSMTAALSKGGFDFSLTTLPRGSSRLVVTGRDFKDVAIVAGTPVEELVLLGTAVEDLRPLGGQPLAELDVSRTRVTDLSALRSPVLSAALRKLGIWRIDVNDFSPLSACRNLEFLDAADTPLADLSVLAERRMRVLLLSGTRVSDLSPLAGMPLERLSFSRTPVTDLGALSGAGSLSDLTLSLGSRDLASLRALPALTRLSYVEADGGFPSQTVAEFWDEFDQGGLKAADIAGLARESSQRPDDSLFALRVAALQAWFGLDADHNETAGRLLAMAGKSQDPDFKERAAKAWCFRAGADPRRLEVVLALAREAASGGESPKQRPWTLQTLGMAEFRAGNLAAAKAAFTESVRVAEADGWHPELRPLIQVPAGFFQAMILSRQGDAEGARIYFEQARSPMETVPPGGEESLPRVVTQDHLLCWLAQREAAGALGR
ncbi:serine/threonine-protein kinase [Luteolibacter marinus]|uniref:serine/threonine-protein kinase n=1 Tax=Luteolibacter marinus TaxID=2776705 RepID=UPI001865AA96|nr:serine/threonine-protein kinase [Luteolibacter marinus]